MASSWDERQISSHEEEDYELEGRYSPRGSKRERARLIEINDSLLEKEPERYLWR